MVKCALLHHNYYMKLLSFPLLGVYIWVEIYEHFNVNVFPYKHMMYAYLVVIYLKPNICRVRTCFLGRVHGHGGRDPGQWHHGPDGQDREAGVASLRCHQPRLPQSAAQTTHGGFRNSGAYSLSYYYICLLSIYLSTIITKYYYIIVSTTVSLVLIFVFVDIW